MYPLTRKKNNRKTEKAVVVASKNASTTVSRLRPRLPLSDVVFEEEPENNTAPTGDLFDVLKASPDKQAVTYKPLSFWGQKVKDQEKLLGKDNKAKGMDLYDFSSPETQSERNKKKKYKPRPRRKKENQPVWTVTKTKSIGIKKLHSLIDRMGASSTSKSSTTGRNEIGIIKERVMFNKAQNTGTEFTFDKPKIFGLSSTPAQKKKLNFVPPSHFNFDSPISSMPSMIEKDMSTIINQSSGMSSLPRESEKGTENYTPPGCIEESEEMSQANGTFPRFSAADLVDNDPLKEIRAKYGMKVPCGDAFKDPFALKNVTFRRKNRSVKNDDSASFNVSSFSLRDDRVEEDNEKYSLPGSIGENEEISQANGTFSGFSAADLVDNDPLKEIRVKYGMKITCVDGFKDPFDPKNVTLRRKKNSVNNDDSASFNGSSFSLREDRVDKYVTRRRGARTRDQRDSASFSDSVGCSYENETAYHPEEGNPIASCSFSPDLFKTLEESVNGDFGKEDTSAVLIPERPSVLQHLSYCCNLGESPQPQAKSPGCSQSLLGPSESLSSSEKCQELVQEQISSQSATSLHNEDSGYAKATSSEPYGSCGETVSNEVTLKYVTVDPLAMLRKRKSFGSSKRSGPFADNGEESCSPPKMSKELVVESSQYFPVPRETESTDSSFIASDDESNPDRKVNSVTVSEYFSKDLSKVVSKKDVPDEAVGTFESRLDARKEFGVVNASHVLSSKMAVIPETDSDSSPNLKNLCHSQKMIIPSTESESSPENSKVIKRRITKDQRPRPLTNCFARQKSVIATRHEDADELRCLPGFNETLSAMNMSILPGGKKHHRARAVLRDLQNGTLNASIIAPSRGGGYEAFVESVLELQQGADASKLGNNTFSLETSRVTRSKARQAQQRRASVRRPPDMSLSRFSCLNARKTVGLSRTLRQSFYPHEASVLNATSVANKTVRVVEADGNHDCTDFRLAYGIGDKSAVDATVVEAKSARDVVLSRCNQTEPLTFEEHFNERTLPDCKKIGEGVYGEVFMYTSKIGKSVFKIIPIEGSQKINDEAQKTFEEILSEVVISVELSNLREGKENKCDGFAEVQRVWCVRGEYPELLKNLWEDYNNTGRSENDHPKVFEEDQLFIILELAHGGADLESFVFENAVQAAAAFKQATFSLAVAEQALQFEHRDFHWGNVLISHTDSPTVRYVVNGETLELATEGVQVTIIDYTLSRMTYDGCSIFNDMSVDPTLFISEGDYQFDIYRMMRDEVKDNWEPFCPRTNVFWLHYAVDKMLTMVRYRRPRSKGHLGSVKSMRKWKGKLLDYSSAYELISVFGDD